MDGRVLACGEGDNVVRWQPGERLEDLFAKHLRTMREEGEQDRLAVDGPAGSLTYGELDARANQLARVLAAEQGLGAGHRVALLLDDAVRSYTAMLAVLKLHAAYVPLDSGFPPDRLGYIVSDSGAGTVLSTSDLREKLDELEDDVSVVALDQLDAAVDAAEDGAPDNEDSDDVDDQLAYLIYTSGTTGRPKGVAITHASACNFIRVAAEMYGMQPDDRVYQGLTIAFDFAVEEIWIPWTVGATLVPKPAGGNLLGPELAAFLKEQRITALCCVPTLLATIDEELPDLRFLLVSGESCPQDLVRRWARDGRRFLNVYGPTEATVTATWTLLRPDRPVTIGVPLPTYFVVILDPDEDRVLDLEEEGEIGIAGIALAEGYLNRPDKTEEAFIDDFLAIEDNPSGRIYRTGDLGRVNGDDEVEHHGRIDTQVKIRGYRIELDEIEAVLREAPGVDQAVISTHQPSPGTDELVAYYTNEDETADEEAIFAHLRDKLPAYMVPAYFERLDDIPLMPSGKADRKQLPAPSGHRRVGAGDDSAPESEVEEKLAQQLADILNVEKVGVESHFFEELGASSLLMAQFSTKLRQSDPALPSVSMRDLYQHPTIRDLARVLSGDGDGASSTVPAFDDPEQPEPIGTPHFILSGVLQVASFLVYVAIAALAFDVATNWLVAGHGVVSIYLRALAVGAGLMTGTGVIPIIAKWVLIGRFKPQRIRVWSLPYVRFWIVKTLILSNPAARLVRGTVLYRFYLRALGARLGPKALILSDHVPICSDLVSIGAGAVIRKDTYLNGYRARDGVIEIGPVAVGAEAFVGERCVIEPYATVQDRATVGHTSSVQSGQVVPAGETWHGSPVQPAEEGDEYRTVEPLAVSRSAQIVFNLLLGLLIALVLAPAEAAAVSLLLAHPMFITDLSTQDALLLAAALMVAMVAIGLLIAGLIPRLLSRLLEPGKVYPLYGPHYALQRITMRMSNVPLLTRLFGDSVLIDGYLRYIGWQLERVVHSGSNFGLDTEQDVPSLTRVGSGTMVSDGLSVMNTEYSNSSFRVMPVQIGAGSFLGNRIAWPAGAHTGDNVLVGTKAMVPLSGELRSDTGLLGSPCFEIPRSVEDDEEFERLSQEPERSRRLRAKTRHNLATMGLYLLSRFGLIAALLALAFAPLSGFAGTAGSEILEVLLVPMIIFGLTEAAVGGRRLQPRQCPVLDRPFWRHERFWKCGSEGWLRVFDGTPFKGVVWRLLGARVGRRLFDDGAGIVERSLTRLGDDVTLNMASEIQGHSLENGMFKSDRIEIASGCTVGVAALVHYGTRMRPGAILEADSFLMKGSEIPENARWRGNPATEVVQHRLEDGDGAPAENEPETEPETKAETDEDTQAAHEQETARR
jgi:non-ribosomal peptide synthetase-like protein